MNLNIRPLSAVRKLFNVGREIYTSGNNLVPWYTECIVRKNNLLSTITESKSYNLITDM